MTGEILVVGLISGLRVWLFKQIITIKSLP